MRVTEKFKKSHGNKRQQVVKWEHRRGSLMLCQDRGEGEGTAGLIGLKLNLPIRVAWELFARTLDAEGLECSDF